MFLIFAQTSEFLPLLASGLVGGGVFVVAWWVVRALQSDDLRQGSEWRYDVSRMNELRKLDGTYRMFFPLIRVFARFNRGAFPDKLPEISRQISAAGLPRFWLPEEYLAKMQLRTLFIAPLFFLLCIRWMGFPGVILATVFSLMTTWFLRRRLASKAKRRVLMIKRRIPYLLDLLTLLMEAGSTFLQSLGQSVEELRGHPVAEEFGRVLVDIHLGKTRRQSFEAMRDRLNDDEIASIITSILQGEELGTPMASVFRTQSDVLRIKRSQNAEAIAGEAGVNMLLPGILIMASTVLIIFGPFVINYLYSGFGM